MVGKSSGSIMIYLRFILEDNFVSQNELSDLLGIERSHLGKLINGKHKSTLKTIKFLAQGLSKVDGQEWIIHAKKIRASMELQNKTIKLFEPKKSLYSQSQSENTIH